MCQPTLDNKQIKFSDVPFVNIPIWQYDSTFRSKDIISEDRARFARAWNNYFNNWGDRGGASPEEAFEAWFRMVTERYKKHVNKTTINNHPKYIKESLSKLEQTQFGYDAFGLKNDIKRDLKDYIIAYKNKFVDSFNI